MTSNLRAAGLVAALTLAWTSVADAQSSAEAARTYFESGTLAFDEARWIDCAHDFERSFALVFAAELLYNIGLCYERAARALPDAQARPLLERALAAYQRYVRELPAASDAGSVRVAIADLQARLEGAEGAVVEEATEAEEPAVSPPRSSSEAVEAEAASAAAPAGPEGDETGARSAPTYAITITGAALTVVALAVAIGLGAHAQGVYSRLASTCGATAAGCTEGQISEVADLSTGANAMYVAAGVMLAGTAVGFAIEFASGADGAPTRAVLAVGGRF